MYNNCKISSDVFQHVWGFLDVNELYDKTATLSKECHNSTIDFIFRTHIKPSLTKIVENYNVKLLTSDIVSTPDTLDETCEWITSVFIKSIKEKCIANTTVYNEIWREDEVLLFLDAYKSISPLKGCSKVIKAFINDCKFSLTHESVDHVIRGDNLIHPKTLRKSKYPIDVKAKFLCSFDKPAKGKAMINPVSGFVFDFFRSLSKLKTSIAKEVLLKAKLNPLINIPVDNTKVLLNQIYFSDYYSPSLDFIDLIKLKEDLLSAYEFVSLVDANKETKRALELKIGCLVAKEIKSFVECKKYDDIIRIKNCFQDSDVYEDICNSLVDVIFSLVLNHKINEAFKLIELMELTENLSMRQGFASEFSNQMLSVADNLAQKKMFSQAESIVRRIPVTSYAIEGNNTISWYKIIAIIEKGDFLGAWAEAQNPNTAFTTLIRSRIKNHIVNVIFGILNTNVQTGQSKVAEKFVESIVDSELKAILVEQLKLIKSIVLNELELPPNKKK